jgi:hypothetical protein
VIVPAVIHRLVPEGSTVFYGARLLLHDMSICSHCKLVAAVDFHRIFDPVFRLSLSISSFLVLCDKYR